MPPTNPRILIAEDESGIADTLQYVLKSDGFTPVWCATAAEALAQFALEPPALAILDVGLPDLNGFEPSHEKAARIAGTNACRGGAGRLPVAPAGKTGAVDTAL